MDVDSKIKEEQQFTNGKQHSNKKLTEKEVKELMRHSSYERRGGAIRQVRQG